MPRPNVGRTINSEANLARRIGLERDTRGWSYEELARRLTDVGCKIASSALFKIEKGTPARRVTVDELVGLSQVFGVPVDHLLLPPEAAYEEGAEVMLKRIDDLTKRAKDLRADLRTLNADLDAELMVARLIRTFVGERWRREMEITGHER